MVQSRKYAILFEKNALDKIEKIDGFKDISEANKKKFVKILWKALNKRADEVYEILHQKEIKPEKPTKKKGKGITPAERMAMTKAPEKKKDESMKIPPSEIPKNVRRALDALSIYGGIGTALSLGGKVLPFLFL